MVPVDDTPVILSAVTASDDDIDALFHLLKKRQFGISHVIMPSFESHRAFVMAHPYLAWYLIQKSGVTVGSIYLLDSNQIGVNMIQGYACCIRPAIELLCAMHQPLPPVASVRPVNFVINVAPLDIEQIKALEEAGAVMIQQTYQLP